MKNNTLGRNFLEVAEIVIIAFALSWVLRTFVVEARVIPSGSMLPTIQLQDRVVVDKIFFKWSGIHRKDIIVFRPPARANFAGQDFIKRVIGLPGETLEVKDGQVYINNKPLTEGYIAEKPDYHYGPVVIPQNAYLVFGDNRNNSADSHEWGLLPASNIEGRALFRYWPLTRFGALAR